MRGLLCILALTGLLLLIGGEFGIDTAKIDLIGSAMAQTTTAPQPPRVFLDSTYVPPTGATITVSAGGSIQNAINLAQPGDQIVLQAGATFFAPSGGLVLPPKSNPNNKWVTITSSNMSSLPAAGSRVSAANSVAMPKILATDSSAALMTQTGPGANNVSFWRIMGIEFSVTPTSMPDANSAFTFANYGLVRLGDPGETNINNVPHDFVIDRCFIHGNPTLNTIRGIGLNSARTSIVDSYISDFHGVQWESQAIACWSGPGPYKINDNYLEAASENIMFGGSDPKILNLVPSDIEIRYNYFFKPLSWKSDDPSYAGYHWTAKNLLELKNSQRVLIQGNLFQNSWGDAQVGYAVLFKSVDQDGTAPWSVTQDVEFRDNLVQHAGGAINIQGHDPDNISGQTARVRIENNLFTDINQAAWNGEGTFLKIFQGLNITLDHNTAMQSDNAITAYGVATVGFVFTNNILPNNTYGVKGDSVATGTDTLNTYFPGYVFQKNAVIGGQGFPYPAGNFFPSAINQVGFVNPAGGNYALAAGTPLKNAGTDGKDVGADVSMMMAAISGTVAPPAPVIVPHLATVLVSDDFSAPSLDITKWQASNLFSGYTNKSVRVLETNQQLAIGPLLANVAGSTYNGVILAKNYDLTGASVSVQLVQAPSAKTAADAMLTVGYEVTNYYRIYVESGNLYILKMIGGTKVTLAVLPYDPVNHSFLSISHDAVTGNVLFETAPSNNGVPGTWALRYSEPWHTASIPLDSVQVELKAGTWRPEVVAPGTVIFDNFAITKP